MTGGASILDSLTGACMVLGIVKIRERVGEFLIYTELENVAGYVTLHDI